MWGLSISVQSIVRDEGWRSRYCRGGTMWSCTNTTAAAGSTRRLGRVRLHQTIGGNLRYLNSGACLACRTT
jgi:hypothetical protein